MSDRLLDAGEIAAMLKMPVSWVRASRAGQLPTVELGRYRRYSREDVLEWVEAQKTGGGARASRKHQPTTGGTSGCEGLHVTDRLLTTRKVADRLGLSVESVLRRHRRGELPGFRLSSNVLRFSEDDLNRWLEERRASGPCTELRSVE